MRHILDSSLPIRTVVLKMAEVSLVLTALLFAFELFAGNELGWHVPARVEAGLLAVLLLLCLYCMDFYEPRITTLRMQSLSRLIQAIGLSMLIIAPLTQLWMISLHPTAAMFGMLLAGACLVTSRYLFTEIAQHPELAEAAVLWGTGELARNIIRELEERPDLGIYIIGVVDQAYDGDAFAGVQYLGSPDLLWGLKDSVPARRIIVAVEERRGALPIEMLLTMKAAGMRFEDGAEFYEELTGKVWLGTFSDSNLLFSYQHRPSFLRRFTKRFFSIVFSAIGLVLALPLMLITVLLIRCESPGPAIFRQTRVGENGKHFTLYKFRSMKMNSDSNTPTAPNDPRCTSIGKWIRRFHVDELPQLVNILKGDMYFIGPRPFVPDQEAALVNEIPHYRQRWTVRPGATGWAQVNRAYCATIEDNMEKLSYDLYYIKNISIGLDLLTLFKTFKVLLLGRGGR